MQRYYTKQHKHSSEKHIQNKFKGLRMFVMRNHYHGIERALNAETAEITAKKKIVCITKVT